MFSKKAKKSILSGSSSSPSMSSSSPSPGTQSPSHQTTPSTSSMNKLAAEYAKLRTQFGVVKRAVVDEQTKNQELSEVLRERELSLRKKQQEMDAIGFRNQQLTKRIMVLQDEIDKKASSSGKHDSSAKDGKGNTNESMKKAETLNSVMGQELSSKIEENARLHAKLSEIDGKYEELVSSLKDRIKDLETESRRRHQAERAEDVQRREAVQSLEEEKMELLQQIQRLDQEVGDQQDRITLLQVQLETSSHQPPVAKSKSSAAVHSLPLTSDEVTVQSVELLSQFGEHITELVAALSDYHTYWEHRLKDTSLDEPLSENASRLSKLLLQNVRHLKPIEEAYQAVVSQVLSAGGAGPILALFSGFSSKFSDYVKYSREMEPLIMAGLKQESCGHSCPENQKELNGKLGSSVRSMNRVMSRISEYLEHGTSRREDSQGSDDEESIENINAALSQLFQQASELSSIYSEKTTEENQLPTVTDQLKNTNQCISSSLTSLSCSLGGLSRMMSDNLQRINLLIKASKGQIPVTMKSKEKELDEPEGQVEEREDKQSQSQGEMDAVKDELADTKKFAEELGDKLRSLEQEREHWKLEFQLLQIKHEKLRNDHGSSTSETDQDKLFAEREEELKKQFAEKTDDLIKEKLESDGKAVSLYLECLGLLKRTAFAEKARDSSKRALQKAQDDILTIKEEMGVTSSNYESQLSLMSEHVATMNEKLAAQTDQIQELRHQLANKKKK